MNVFGRVAEPIPIGSGPCKKSPTGYGTFIQGGKTYYQCCGKKFGTAPGEIGCTGVPDKAITMLGGADSTRRTGF
jgi:hypothetical protein